MQESEISKMKVADLKRELKIRGLSTNGNKTELIERLQTSAIDGIEGDELLDESVLTDEDEANILAEDENELLQSPSSLKIRIGETKDEDELLLSPNTTKKVVLKRKNSFKDLELEETTSTLLTTSKENNKPIITESGPKILKMSERNPITVAAAAGAATTTTTASSVVEEDNAANKSENKSTVKLSQLSEKERLELRAKKFGQNSSAATDLSNFSAGFATSNLTEEQIEKLKKRAERFGVVSPAIAKLDEKEKLLKRKERFGEMGDATNKSTTTGGSDNNNDVWAEKARQRLERFKTAPTPVVVDKH